VIDYIFRDLAISYLKRTELGQIKPEDLLSTGTKSDAPEKHSSGFRPHGHGAPGSTGGGKTPAVQGSGGTAKTAAVPDSRQTPQAKTGHPEDEAVKIAQARIKGYEGDPCPACGSFTLIRNGTCMKCDTCGGTTGCS
ncbi:MAG: vitamin B12-dependent ribonucleotide reductase, partial [Treponema sp.]|nr:vitamin B12-dependent ribonucleotide reductase [Treponema sp.]